MSYLYAAVVEDCKSRLFTFWARSSQDLDKQIGLWCRSRWPSHWNAPPSEAADCIDPYFEGHEDEHLRALDPLDMELLNSPLVECWDCVDGLSATAASNTAGADIVCGRCKGVGRCPEVMWEWFKQGTELRERRQRIGLSLRENAKLLGVNTAVLSDAERGRINPAKLRR